MKKILPMLLMTVMLRVWWSGHTILSTQVPAGDGIFLYSAPGSMDEGPIWGVVKNNGEVIPIFGRRVYKTKWVEVKAEREK